MRQKTLFSCLLWLSASVALSAAHADTLKEALAQTYNNNPTLNSARAGTRAIDEDIAIAKSGYRPIIQGVGNINRTRSMGMSSSGKPRAFYTNTGSLGIQVSQKLFDGLQTFNNVRASKAQAAAQREQLRNEEQNQLNNAVSAYADLYAKRQIVALRRENLAALNEQVRVDQSRLDVGEGTRTDLAQSKAAQSQAVSELSQAQAAVKSAEAYYQQVVGVSPGKLERPALAASLPDSVDAGYAVAQAEHPAIKSSQYAKDARAFTVKVKEGALLPQADAQASASYDRVFKGQGVDGRANNMGVSLNVPIYQGGRLSAEVRQSKEQLGQASVELDLYRDMVRESMASSWSQLEGARASVLAYSDSVRAAQIALSGRMEEYQVGQATTLDVLNSRTVLISSKIALVQSEREAVIASYNVQSATGRMTADHLGLQVQRYDPKEHYDAVKNKWIGTRTPDGR